MPFLAQWLAILSKLEKKKCSKPNLPQWLAILSKLVVWCEQSKFPQTLLPLLMNDPHFHDAQKAIANMLSRNGKGNSKKGVYSTVDMLVDRDLQWHWLGENAWLDSQSASVAEVK